MAAARAARSAISSGQKKRAPCGALARRTKPKDRDSISVHDVSSFCNPDHRSSQGSGRAHCAPRRRAAAETQSRPPHAARRRSRATRAEGADANGRPRPGRRESRARQREGQREDSQHAPPDGRAPLYPVPPPAGWITAVGDSSAAAGAIRAVSIAMP